jgi:outer membrane biosynthesis protein TonB
LTWRQIPPAPEKLVALRTPSPEPAPVKSAEATAPPPASAKIEAPAEPKKIEKPAAPIEPKKTETPPAPAKTDAAVAPRKMDTSVVIALLRRADELMAAGDLGAARLLLQRVAETKNAQAAFRLASTYDPAVLKKLSNNSVAADPALAQLWYERARDWGSPEATSPLEALASRATAK